MLIKTYGSAVHGVNAITITLEVNVGQGVSYYIVGLPDNAVKESRQRIEAAIKNNGFKMPHNKVIVNMRSEEHTSELQSRGHLVCRLLLEKKNILHNLINT